MVWGTLEGFRDLDLVEAREMPCSFDDGILRCLRHIFRCTKMSSLNSIVLLTSIASLKSQRHLEIRGSLCYVEGSLKLVHFFLSSSFQ